MSETRTAPRSPATPPDPEHSETFEEAVEDAFAQLGTPWSRTERPIPRAVVQPMQRFMHTEIAAGIVVLAAAVTAIILANSPLADLYHRFWETEFGIELAGFGISMDLHHWVNDLVMAVFFFVVGVEIKRELVHGDLRDPRAAALPVIAAVGGMLVPAAIYAALNAGESGANGWAIPMATDIAFAMGVLSLVGKRAPTGLKVFLLTLAVADDIGAILVIAIFYSSGVQFAWLGAAAATIAVVVALTRIGVRSSVPYTALAGALWVAMFFSGVHATIAGVILGLLVPAHPFHRAQSVATAVRQQLRRIGSSGIEGDERDEQRMLEISRLAREGVSPLARHEATLHLWSAFVILPLFALANAGVPLNPEAMQTALTNPVTLGVALGLVLGKPLGIVLFSWLGIKVTRGRLPVGVGWGHMTGLGLLAGIGFTVALFVSSLSFSDEAVTDAAKVGIFAASAIAGLVGASTLAVFSNRSRTRST